MRSVALALLGGLLAVTPVLAQTPPAKAPAYDTKAEVTIAGIVEDFHTSQARTDHPGLHLILKTETESLEVHTCPLRFMKELEFEIAKGDTVKVVGSRPGGGGVVLAREITKGQTSLTVRDKDGSPVWTGR